MLKTFTSKQKNLFILLSAAFLTFFIPTTTHAQVIFFSGDATADFAPLGAALQVSQSDVTNDIGFNDPNCGPPAGFNFQHVYMRYDPGPDRMYIGLDLVGLAGDVDNNGDAFTIAAGCTETEYPGFNAGGDEPIGVALNMDNAGLPEYWVGYPNMGTNPTWLPFGLYAYLPGAANDYPLAINNLDPTPLAAPFVLYPWDGDPTKPDVEFTIDNYSTIDPDLSMTWKAFSDANTNGEDNVTGTFSGGAALPINFDHFYALLKDKITLLSWVTRTEKNTDHFEVEHSTDGKNYTKIGTQTAVGNSDKESAYNFKHETPAKGTNYYRIRQVDIDGKNYYSDIRTITLKEDAAFSIHPNPAKGNISISGKDAELYDYKIQNLVGVEMPIVYDRQAGNVYINIQALPAGVYIVYADSPSDQKVVKLLVQ